MTAQGIQGSAPDVAMPSPGQLDAIQQLAQQHGVDPLKVELDWPPCLPEGWLSLKVAGRYYTCTPAGEVL